MKAEELMIGDWVNNGSANFQITGTQLFDLYMGYMDEPQPVHVTPKILEANGFAQAIVCNEEVYVHTEGPHLFYYPDIQMLSIATEANEVLLYSTCLHQIQHALRLCGLTELANNLKVK